MSRFIGLPPIKQPTKSSR